MLEENELLTSLQSLPEPIKEVVYDFYKTVMGHQDNDPNQYHIKMACINYLKKALPAFTDDSVQKVWAALLKSKSHNSNMPIHSSAEAKAKKVAQVLLYMENNFEFAEDSYSRVKAIIKIQKKFLSSIQKSIKIKKSIYLHNYNEDEDIKSLEAIERKTISLIQNIETNMGDIRDFQTKFIPLTRQSKGTGKATLVACFLQMTFKTLYNKPMHANVALLVNAIFKTRYTETAIAAMTQRSKKLLKENSNEILSIMHEYSFRTPVYKKGLSLFITSPIQRKIYQSKNSLKSHLLS